MRATKLLTMIESTCCCSVKASYFSCHTFCSFSTWTINLLTFSFIFFFMVPLTHNLTHKILRKMCFKTLEEKIKDNYVM